MFIRTVNKPTKTCPFNQSIQIVSSIRHGNKVQQKIIKHIGVARSEAELIDLKALVASIKYQLKHQEQASLFDNQDIEQITRDKIQKELTQASNNQTQTKTQAQYNDEDYQLDIRGLKEEQRIINGIHDIYGKLFNNLGLKHIFYNPARQLSSVNIFKEMVLARIANPDSKRGSVNHLAKQFGVNYN